jgi:hypothetical protein
LTAIDICAADAANHAHPGIRCIGIYKEDEQEDKNCNVNINLYLVNDKTRRKENSPEVEGDKTTFSAFSAYSVFSAL